MGVLTVRSKTAASKLLLITTNVKKQRKNQHFSFDLLSPTQSVLVEK